MSLLQILTLCFCVSERKPDINSCIFDALSNMLFSQMLAEEKHASERLAQERDNAEKNARQNETKV